MAEEIQINGYMLAGGKSSRMGADKGLLDFNGKLIVQIILDQIRPAVNKIIIVSNNPEYEKFGVEVIPDLVKDKGPAGGIHAALNHTDRDQIFIVSCDMPFVSTEAIQFMVNNAFHTGITLPVYDLKMQPLFGVYSKDCSILWSGLIEQGMIKLQEMVTHFDLLKIDVDNNELFNDSLFLNINDKNDFQNALKLAQDGN